MQYLFISYKPLEMQMIFVIKAPLWDDDLWKNWREFLFTAATRILWDLRMIWVMWSKVNVSVAFYYIWVWTDAGFTLQFQCLAEAYKCGAVIPVSYSCMEKFKLPVASFYNLTVFDISGIFGKSYCWLEFKLKFFDFKQSSASQHASVMMDPGKCL